MIVKAVRQTDENATGQHASENTVTKMDETRHVAIPRLSGIGIEGFDEYSLD